MPKQNLKGQIVIHNPALWVGIFTVIIGAILYNPWVVGIGVILIGLNFLAFMVD